MTGCKKNKGRLIGPKPVLPRPGHDENGSPMTKGAQDDKDMPDAVIIAVRAVVDKKVDAEGVDYAFGYY